MVSTNDQENSNQNQQIDLEKAPIEEVISELDVNPKIGLTQQEAAERLKKYGPNALTQKEQSFWSKLIHHFMGPIAYMIEAAAIVSAVIGHWEDFAIILALLLFNVTIEMIQDRKASSALTALKQGLAPEATVLRDGKFESVPASTLVPGDIVKIRLGMIVPADVRLIEGDYVSIDQAALTGESLPVTKHVGAEAYSGSVVKQGEMLAVVTATGENTFFGRTAKLVANAGTVSHAQKAMFQIGNFLIIVAVILAAIMVAFRVYRDIFVTGGWGMTEALNILQFVLVLLVASIPVAMPTVFSITLALGAIELSKEKAIVSKLSAIEEMAGVDILCSDKTGTLTKNELTLNEPILIAASNPEDCILAGALASKLENKDAIDTAIIDAVKDKNRLQEWTLDKFIPFDPVTKRTEGRLHNEQGEEIWVSKGAPQVIVALVNPDEAEANKIMGLVDDLAGKGYRALGVAESKDQGKNWSYLGILPMFDPPRDDSAATIKAALEKGVSIKMITGDDTAIAIETARQLGMGTNILNASEVFPKDMDPDNVPSDLIEVIENANGFARVFPEHKYAIVKALQKEGHLVAMTGDGVNDAPALKQADCGIAVADSTDAARGAADLILTAPGLSVIETAINEARQIFERITSYTVYRVALTITIMFLVVLSSIIFNFQPLTAIMIVIMSLLDDIPIMAIAYDNTSVSPDPIRWKMSKILSVSTILGFFAVVQSVALLYMGHHAVISPESFRWLEVSNMDQLQTIMFLQLVAGGHLLLFITRQTKWFFQKPYPSSILFWAITATQIIAILMCYFGWFVPKISIMTIVVVWVYNLIWMFILGFIRIACEKYIEHRTARQRQSIKIVNESLVRK